jgi:hypothetical protein
MGYVPDMMGERDHNERKALAFALELLGYSDSAKALFQTRETP